MSTLTMERPAAPNYAYPPAASQYVTGNGGHAVLKSDDPIVERREGVKAPLLAAATTCSYCGRVTPHRYAEIVVQSGEVLYERTPSLLLGQGEHDPDCPTLDPAEYKRVCVTGRTKSPYVKKADRNGEPGKVAA